MDPRTLDIKYRIPASEIYRISLSPFEDNIAVIHICSVSNVMIIDILNNEIIMKKIITSKQKREKKCLIENLFIIL